MVRLLKYFETDDCVYLMLEYCSSGTIWDIVKLLVRQKEVSSFVKQEEFSSAHDLTDKDEPFERSKTPVKKQTSIIKPSESFIRDRKISINACNVSNTQVCDFDDISIVQANNDSVVVVNNDGIEHFEGYDESE